MCSPCCGGCFGYCGGCGVCCYSKPLAISQKLSFPDDYRWFQRCTSSSCTVCQSNKDHECACVCRRNRHIVEALAYLFNSTIPYMLSILFKLAFQQNQPMKRFPRDRQWDVMEHVKAPYTELNDLEIYDSMYDRCGLPINPLHFDNIFKIVRMMFLITVLTIDQQKYLLQMLQRLNAHAHYPVDLDLLLRTLEGVDLKELVCSIQNQEAIVRRLYTARHCNDICQLYQQVVTVDKNAVKRRRKRIKYNKKSLKSAGEIEESPSVRQTQLNRQFCERKSPDIVFSGESPNNTTPSSGRNRNSGHRSRSVSSSRNPSRSSKQH
ncbi:hypothetical protein ACLKA7_001622 [Drosophila subpalustris]